MTHTATLLGIMLIAMQPAYAQRPPQPRGVDVNFSLAPTVNWLTDVQISLGDLQTMPGGQPSEELQERADSLLLLFNEVEFPAQIGFEAGLSMTASRGLIGLRAGLHLLNTGGQRSRVL